MTAPRTAGAARWADRAWPGAIALTLLLGIVSGGSSEAQSAAFFLFRLLCMVILGVGLLRLLPARLGRMERLGLGLAAAAVLLVALHLVPLPWGVFSGLAGRDYVATAFGVAGIAPQAMPLSLSPEATRAALLTLLPPLAIFIAVLTVDSRSRWLLVATVLAGVIASVILGLAQRFQGPKSSLYLYEIANFGSATGFFSNRNNFAMLLAVSIPLTWALTYKMMRRSPGNSALILAGGAVMLGIILTGLAVSSSRSGILLGMLALALSTAMVWSPPKSSRRASRARMSMLAMLGGALIIGQFGMIGLLRIAETDPLTEHRNQLSAVTLKAASTYFPWGSGFGTFPKVYQMHETPATMVSAFTNHAHNDWLELWLEGGLPAALLLACFVALFAARAARVWNPKGAYAEHVLPRAASVGVLVLMLHSLVEYPLRMPALAGIFAALTAMLLAAAPYQHSTTSKRSARQDDAPLPEPATAFAVAPLPPVFKVASAGTQQARHGGLERDALRR